MNAIDTSALFTEVAPEESAVVNGGFTGLGGFDFQGNFYNPGILLLPNPEIFSFQLRFAQDAVAGGLWDGFLQGGTSGQIGYTFDAYNDVLHWAWANGIGL